MSHPHTSRFVPSCEALGTGVPSKVSAADGVLIWTVQGVELRVLAEFFRIQRRDDGKMAHADFDSVSHGSVPSLPGMILVVIVSEANDACNTNEDGQPTDCPSSF